MSKDVHIRWMIRRDMPEVMNIEAQCFGDHAWDEDDFIRYLHQRNCLGMVAEEQNKIVGFMIYELAKDYIHILDFAVDEGNRRRGVGKAMAEKLSSKLSQQRRRRIILKIRETNLSAQKFFGVMGYRATRVESGIYHDCDDDAYVMVYRLGEEFTAEVTPVNRVRSKA